MSRDVNIDELETFEDDRGGFDGGPKKKVPGLRAFIGVLLLIALCLIGWIVYKNVIVPKLQQQEQAEKASPNRANNLPRASFATTPGNADEEPVEQPAEQAQSASTYQQQAHQTQPGQQGKVELTPEQKAMQRRLSSSSATEQIGAQAMAATPSRGEKAEPVKTSSSSSELASRMNSARYAASKATLMKNMGMSIAAGTMIRCGTITELDTTVPGFVSCQVSKEVRSADGSVVLIDKGATITGEVSGGILMGQARAFVLWSRVRNRDGAVAYLDAPGTNRLGSAGVPGQVDTHFWDRFGGAMFISVFSDLSRGLMQALVNSTDKSDSDTTVNLDNTSNTSDSLAREVLRATINIPPTLTVNHGEAVSIFVPRDVDFSDVYGLEMVE
ncbi:TPA: type IV secretion system protein VirB10 [Pseudomonas putida]|jgi:type IV secretion system protein VirB10|uniref:Inner membrane protein forms channel for type IV secretion of T-DNA complex (VirB10) n=4 Tax=Pseudomonadaceae TaxID=135621 RepID=A0A8E3MBD4_ECTME|nr:MULTISPECIES: type IV secretion system protein VirB10 [Pseudomonas]MBJ2238458.1 type IV secretion system protein VirB10 [Pseudomonas fluorescens]ANY85601.1 TraF protein [Pseudomonas putida]MBH9179347.1 type IV secretion system protein VirB10 [Pseudomonas aeruginosa]MCE0757376.1 type IV secretion system protein VirB10 [Pseudomonas asiatica]MCE0963180.1 type IV secretion system protein VirB10 [Pseudomonas putida]